MKRLDEELFPFVKEESGRTVQQIKCSACATTDGNVLVSGRAMAGNPQLVTFFRRRGWRIDERKRLYLCAPCARTADIARRKSFIDPDKSVDPDIQLVKEAVMAAPLARATAILMAPVPAQIAPQGVKPNPSPDSVLAKKMASDLMFENYDTSIPGYKPGWNDARIAKESGLSVEWVASRRQVDLGPAGPAKPPADVAAREAFGKIVAEANEAIAIGASIAIDAGKIIDRGKRLLALAEDALKELTPPVAKAS